MRAADARLAAEGICLATNQMPCRLMNRAIEPNGVFEAAKELGASNSACSPSRGPSNVAGPASSRFPERAL